MVLTTLLLHLARGASLDPEAYERQYTIKVDRRAEMTVYWSSCVGDTINFLAEVPNAGAWTGMGFGTRMQDADMIIMRKFSGKYVTRDTFIFFNFSFGGFFSF